MPKAGDSFIVELKPAHLSWGTLGDSRTGVHRSGFEAYIQINKNVAETLNITAGSIYKATSADGYLHADVKASGSQGQGNQFAKQFQGSGDLRILGYWLKDRLNAKPGDQVKVEFTSSQDVFFTHIPV